MGYNVSDYNIKKNNILDILSELKELDFVFIGLHGTFGEDGTIQDMLDFSEINYNGSGYLSSQLCFDKHQTKLCASQNDVLTPAYFHIYENNNSTAYEDVLLRHTLSSNMDLKKWVIKPNKQGSSIGFSMLKDISNTKTAIRNVLKYDDSALIEKYIEGREITVPVLDYTALPVIEIKPHSNIYDYKSKYTKGESDYICPAEIDDSLSEEIKDTALKIHKLLGCQVYSRVDFRLDKDNKLWFLEINTLPGMTETSLFPMAAKASGLSFEDLIDKIIKLSLEK